MEFDTEPGEGQPEVLFIVAFGVEREPPDCCGLGGEEGLFVIREVLVWHWLRSLLLDFILRVHSLFLDQSGIGGQGNLFSLVLRSIPGILIFPILEVLGKEVLGRYLV